MSGCRPGGIEFTRSGFGGHVLVGFSCACGGVGPGAGRSVVRSRGRIVDFGCGMNDFVDLRSCCFGGT